MQTLDVPAQTCRYSALNHMGPLTCLHLAALSLEPSMPAFILRQHERLETPVPQMPAFFYSSSFVAAIDLKECPEAVGPFFKMIECDLPGIDTERVQKNMKDPSLMHGEFG